MATTHDRPVISFPPAARTTLTNGGTVVGGNGATYKYDPLTGNATVVSFPGGAPPAPEPDTRRGIQTPAERADLGPRTEYTSDSPNFTPGQSSGAAPAGAAPAQTAVDLEAEARAAAERARQGDARARITSVLSEYGLESLADFVWQQILAGKSDAEVLQDIRNTSQFKERFPAIAERTAKGLAPISPGEYVAYERQARQIMRAAGLPENFYDGRDDFTRFLSGDVSIAELNDRVQLGRRAAYEAAPEVRDTLLRDYGVTEGGLTAYFLDPDRAQPLLEKQYAASQIGGAGSRTGFGSTRLENERLVELGVTEQQAQQGFGTLVDSKELFGSLDRTEDQIGRDEQLGAAFMGNANAQRRIENRRRKRQATFEGGGAFATGQQGVSGLGGTDR